MIVYGINAVSEALRAGRVRQIRIAGRDDDRIRQVMAMASESKIPVRQVSRDQLDRDARDGGHQGIVADVTPVPESTLDELVRSATAVPLLVVLDGVEDPQNVGAILRTVDAAGATGVVRQTRRAAPLEGAASKASAGAVHHVPVANVVNVARAVEELKDLGVWTVGLDAESKTPYYDLDLTTPIALVVGAEGYGLRRLVRERCDFMAAIPMAGHVKSLNVSAATAIVLFEAVRQRQKKGFSRLPRGAGADPEPGEAASRARRQDPGGG